MLPFCNHFEEGKGRQGQGRAVQIGDYGMLLLILAPPGG